MDNVMIQNWSIIGLAVFAFLICVAQTIFTEPEVAFVCLIGVILVIGVGIVQIHIRKVV